MIATNQIHDYFEARKRLQTVSLEDLERRFRAGETNVIQDWHAVEQLHIRGAEETVCAMEETAKQQELVTEALRQVPGRSRRCFYMKDVEGRSHQEIAQALAISESAARSYASRGRKAFLGAVAELRTQQEGGMQ